MFFFFFKEYFYPTQGISEFFNSPYLYLGAHEGLGECGGDLLHALEAGGEDEGGAAEGALAQGVGLGGHEVLQGLVGVGQGQAGLGSLKTS